MSQCENYYYLLFCWRLHPVSWSQLEGLSYISIQCIVWNLYSEFVKSQSSDVLKGCKVPNSWTCKRPFRVICSLCMPYIGTLPILPTQNIKVLGVKPLEASEMRQLGSRGGFRSIRIYYMESPSTTRKGLSLDDVPLAKAQARVSRG